MTDSVVDWKEPYRLAIQESIRFLGRDGKFEREAWVVSQLLCATGIPFQDSQLLSSDEPVDVAFQEARFQVKELMEPGRRRSDELREDLRKLESAESEADLLETYTPRDISFSDVVTKALAKAAELEKVKYGPSERQSLELICYFNWLDYSVVPPLDYDQIITSFRSVSVVSNTYCAVFFATERAPNLLKSNLGRLEISRASDR